MSYSKLWWEHNHPPGNLKLVAKGCAGVVLTLVKLFVWERSISNVVAKMSPKSAVAACYFWPIFGQPGTAIVIYSLRQIHWRKERRLLFWVKISYFWPLVAIRAMMDVLVPYLPTPTYPYLPTSTAQHTSKSMIRKTSTILPLIIKWD